jgi:putative ABC transport system permease protein
MRTLPLDHAVRNLGRSPLRTSLAIAAATLVALLAAGGVGFSRGMSGSLGASGLATNVILLGTGSEESLERSEIPPGVAEIVAASVDGLARRREQAFVSPEVHVALPIGRDDTAGDGAGPVAVVRGVTAAAFLVHPQVRVITGRAPEPGADEAMVGGAAAAMLSAAGLEAAPGSTLVIAGRPFAVTGSFAAPGTVLDGEIWVPLAALKTLTQRATNSAVIVGLDTAELADLETFAAIRTDLELAAIGEADYYAELSRFLAPVRWLVSATAILVSLGGLLAGLGTLDAIFAARVREFGTLQALGFRRRAIALSMLTESLLVASLGGLLAGAIAVVALDGLAVRSQMGSFAVEIGPAALATGLLAALVLAVLGTALPAFRCLRRPVPEALKAAG